MQLRARERSKYVANLPPECVWLAQCSKTQICFAVLKIALDDAKCIQFVRTVDSTIVGTGNGALTGAQISTECFYVLGNAASAIAHLQTLYQDVNFASWWRRYVRRAEPFIVVAKGHLSYNQFQVPSAPAFFSEMQVLSTDHSTVTSAKTQTESNTDKDEHVLPPLSPKSEFGAHTIAQTLACASSVKLKRSVYTCKICGQPKRGHICSGIAPPPVPNMPSDILEQPPKLPPMPEMHHQPTFSDVFKFESSYDDEKANSAFAAPHYQQQQRSSTASSSSLPLTGKRRSLYTTSTKTARTETVCTEFDFSDNDSM